nr:GRB2-associated-binding protein 3 [Vulpes vulpes]
MSGQDARRQRIPDPRPQARGQFTRGPPCAPLGFPFPRPFREAPHTSSQPCPRKAGGTLRPARLGFSSPRRPPTDRLIWDDRPPPSPFLDVLVPAAPEQVQADPRAAVLPPRERSAQVQGAVALSGTGPGALPARGHARPFTPAWRKRWFVLRRGRMSGNPDVLEYYRNKHSSKPIRVIDLSECAVWKHVGPGFVRKEFQNNFVFIVKTTSRTFYLVAKTEVEMLVWVYSISQVCNLGHLEDGAGESRVGGSVRQGVARGAAADVEGQSLRQRDKRLSLNLGWHLPGNYGARLSARAQPVLGGGVGLGAPYAWSACGRCSGAVSRVPGRLGGAEAEPDWGCSDSPTAPDALPPTWWPPPPPLSPPPPPPVNRDLKPQRRPRPPPLDLRNLSTIREHASLTRTCTVPCNRTRFLSPERNGINSARFFADCVSREEEESYIQMNHRTANPLGSGALTWTKKFSLDYLALDFNSASPAPAQQKLLLAEEQRVDYVQVDEQKTQALQSTKQEWTDERQSKV